ncbi:BppU family phage baseplate upper protein [Enterococcus faecium]|uniref:BppU family phage baseplate upper protein n=1 Tax=Enterococcus faecium TaxID=1352 RepID=UPI001E532D20|nr:BppU family phage baseplate upper protein [Enterococcus faecium]MCE3184122.1 phage baseplate upper protein [Enterococcus faecium]MCU2104579.1 phage baseplate upper protein [Enterococcus faecium]
MFKINESIIVIQAEAINPIQTNVVFWSHDRGTAKLRMKLVRKNGVPQSLPEGTTVPIRLMFRSATAEGGYGKHDYLATVEDPVNGIVSIVLEDNILGYVGTVEGSVYIDFPNDRSLDTAGRFTFYIKRSPIDDSTPELENYYFNGFSQTIDKIEKILADGKQEIDQKITESETQIDAKLKDTNDKITKANQKITEYDQNLNEMRNGMKLYEAWAWSKDGTDRFTRKYPGENYAKNSRRALELSNVTNNINLLKGDVPYNFADLAGKTVTISVEIEVKNAQPQTSGVDFRIGCEASIPRASGGTFYLGVWEKLSAGQTIATKRISRTLSIPNDIVATQASGLHLYVQANGDYFRVSKPKIEIGDTPTIYTPAPSEDYENAYPQYRGLALLPSDLPDDYSWDVTPEYVEKGLNNTVSLTEPETVLGLKNFKDGAQIDGVDVATVKNLGSVLQSGSGLTTIQSDKQSAFDEFSYEFERIGDRVFFHARVKTNSTTAVASHVNLLEIPLGFQFPVEWTIVGIPLSVVQWTTPQGEISALVITDLTGKQVVKFATNRVGNHYISGEWRTADSYPETK